VTSSHSSKAPRTDCVVRIPLALALACYPLLMYFLLDNVAHPYLIGAFGLLVGIRFILIPHLSKPALTGGLLALLLYCGLAVLDPQLSILKLYPMLMNLGIAVYAIYTLVYPPSAIERLSRMMGMQVEGPAIVYTRRLTMVWVAFFVANAGISGYTAIAAPTSTWAWYNGLISYALVGLLIVGEYPVRILYQKRHRLP
jgi:uncharacterized membrane protein